MPKTLSQVIKDLPPGIRAKVEAETKREIEQVMTLRELRKAFRLSQEEVAEALEMEQESVSRIERRADVLLSTMRKYVSAVGGELKLMAKFPGRAPIRIETLAQLRAAKRAGSKGSRRVRAE